MWAELQHLSDAELVEAVRRGESDAFDVLFRRHYAGACDYAARFASADQAPDRAAEGFSRVYRVMLKGQGPDTNFRGYLYTAVRNAHVDAVRRGHGEVPVDDLGTDLPASDDVEDDVLSRIEATPIRRAFARLRPAWRTVLWHTVVLGETHEQVAQRLGSNPNAIAVLSFRAREGLRQAYLAEHVSATDDRACERVAPYLPRYVRGQLSVKRERVVAEHVETCKACRGAVADLTVINTDLGAVLTPALLLLLPGVAGGAAFKGAVLGFLSGTSKTVRGAAGAAVGAVAAVVVGVTLTMGSEAEPRAKVPEPISEAPTTSEGRPSAPAPRPTPDPPAPVTVPPTVEPAQVERVAAPRPADPLPPQPPPTTSPPPTTPPPPAPRWLTQTRATVVGTELVRHAWVVFDVTPAAADGLVVRIGNARFVAVGGSGVSCPLTWPRGEEAVVTCAIRPEHPPTFRLSVHVTFADPAAPVSGSVALTGVTQAGAEDFVVSRERGHFVTAHGPDASRGRDHAEAARQ